MAALTIRLLVWNKVCAWRQRSGSDTRACSVDVMVACLESPWWLDSASCPKIYGMWWGLMNVICHSVNVNWVAVLLRGGGYTITLHAVIKLVWTFCIQRWWRHKNIVLAQSCAPMLSCQWWKHLFLYTIITSHSHVVGVGAPKHCYILSHWWWEPWNIFACDFFNDGPIFNPLTPFDFFSVSSAQSERAQEHRETQSNIVIQWNILFPSNMPQIYYPRLLFHS